MITWHCWAKAQLETHHGVRPRIDDLLWAKRAWSGFSAYAESKLCDVLLAFAVARRWKDVKSNALEAAMGQLLPSHGRP